MAPRGTRSFGRGARLATAGLALALALIASTLAAPPIGPQQQTAADAAPATSDLVQRTRHKLGLADCALTPVRLVPAAADDDDGAADAADDGAVVELMIDGQPCTVALEPISLRADGYQLFVQGLDGSLAPVESDAVRTFRGHVMEHPESRAALSLTDHGLIGAIRIDGSQWRWIEPVSDPLPGEPLQRLHAVYRSEDVQFLPVSCGVNENFLRAVNPARAHQHQGDPPPPGAGDDPPALPALGICTAQLAVDADFEFFQAYGSVAAVEARINAIVNAVNLQYESEVGIAHQVSAIIVRTAEPDPYTSLDPNALLDQLVDQWNNNHGGIQRDLVQLFTGKNLNGSTIGLAYVGVVCDTAFAYSLVQSDFSGNFACVTDLTAHELGHNWNAVHCACSSPPYTMNPSAVCANTFDPATSIPEITAYRNSIGCLSCGPLFGEALNFAGASPGDQFGRSIAFAGDLTGDGEREFIVGAPFNDEKAVNAGKVQVHDGATGAVLWFKRGVAAGDRFGWSVAFAAGHVFVGAPFQDSRGPDAGRVYIYDASTGAFIGSRRGQAAGDRLGWALDGGGDVNHDATADIIAGAPLHDANGPNAGAAYIYKGGNWTLHKKLLGENAGDQFGASVAFLGRVNSDLHDDVAVGAPCNDQQASNAGKAYVYSGKTFAQLFAKTGEKAGDRFAFSLAGPGRMNSGPRSDLVVAAPWANPNGRNDAGSVYAYAGPTGNLLWTRHGATAGDRFGLAIAPAGDANEDARADVIIGSPRNDVPGQNAGRAFVVSGPSGVNLQVLSGESPGDQFGWMVAGRGGLGNASAARLIVAAPLNDAGASNGGRIYRFHTAAATQSMAAPPPCSCDVAGGDGVVDAHDVMAVVQGMSACQPSCPPCPGDVNGDCVIDGVDVIAVLAAWGACE